MFIQDKLFSALELSKKWKDMRRQRNTLYWRISVNFSVGSIFLETTKSFEKKCIVYASFFLIRESYVVLNWKWHKKLKYALFIPAKKNVDQNWKKFIFKHFPLTTVFIFFGCSCFFQNINCNFSPIAQKFSELHLYCLVLITDWNRGNVFFKCITKTKNFLYKWKPKPSDRQCLD